MRTFAPNPPNCKSEIDALTRAFQSPSTFNPLARANLAGLLKDVEPSKRRRHRAWTQRDITRLIRGAKAAGMEARVVSRPDYPWRRNGWCPKQYQPLGKIPWLIFD